MRDLSPITVSARSNPLIQNENGQLALAIPDKIVRSIQLA
jgi:hypothetical protein